MSKQHYISTGAPQATHLERSVLGILLSDGAHIDRVMELLQPESFCTPIHATIFRNMCLLEKQGKPADPISLTEQLHTAGKLDEIGGAHYLQQLANAAINSTPLLHHALLLKEKHLKREQLRIAETLHKKAAGTDDVFETFEQVQQELLHLSSHTQLRHIAPIARVADQVLKDILAARAATHDLTGIPTGFSELDFHTNGWQPSDLIVIAARPGIGKTAFSLNLAINCATDLFKPTAVALFNLEMQDTQVIKRGIAAQSRVPLASINRPKNLTETELQQIHEASDRLRKIPLYIEDTPALTTNQLRTKMRRYVNKHNIGLVIVDYLQLMAIDKQAGNREQEVSQVSRDLKRIAKELKLPIIALSQLNRDIERRSNKEPTLADLRESGAIEQDADMILFLYPPSEDAIKKDGDLSDKVLLSCKKHRNGELFEILLRFDKGIQLFGEGH